MAGEHIEMHTEGFDALDAQFARTQVNASRVLKNLVAGGAHYSASWMRMYVHVYSGYTIRHIDSTGAEWRPGGASGGGEWHAVAGVKRGTSKHPLYADQGTGIYVGHDLIRPLIPFQIETAAGRRGGVLTFQKLGEPRRFVRWVRGQRAQHFLYASYQQTRLYIGARMVTLMRDILR